MQIQKCIHTRSLSNFLFPDPSCVHISLTVCLCRYFHFLDETVFYVMKFTCDVSSASSPYPSKHHLCRHTRVSSLSLSSCLLPLRHHSVPLILYPPPIHKYIPSPTHIPLFTCGTKLIEDDWFFPGCSDSALETRQQELEEELAQARGLGQHRAKKLAAPSQRSLQVGGHAGGPVGRAYLLDDCMYSDGSEPM